MGKKAFEHYDFTSPWNIQVEIYSGTTDVVQDPAADIPEKMTYSLDLTRLIASQQASQERAKKDMGSWEIKRHKKFGEVPDHKERAKAYPREYSYNLNHSR